MMTYQATNIRGQWKRAFCSAIFVGMGGVGGIAGSLVFRSQDAPEYVFGIYACIVADCLVIVTVLIMTWVLMSENKKQARGEKILEGEPGFRYTP
jgi:tellurite resistance protein TehA-like permease